MTSYLAKYGSPLITLGYKIIPIKPGSKAPGLPGWQNIEATAADVKKWVSNGFANGGVGVLARNTPAIDIDVLDPEMVAAIQKIIVEELGMTPPLERVGKVPKLLIPCRTSAPFKKVQSAIFTDPDGRDHKVEILGDGQQFVAYADHPDTGQPYDWMGPFELVDFPVSELPELTHEVAVRIVNRASQLMADTGWKMISKGSKGSVSAGPVDPLANAVPPVDLTVEEFRRLLWLEDPVDRGNWVDMGMICNHQFNGSTEGFEIWDEWSQQADNYLLKETHEEMRARYDGFRSDLSRKPLTARTLIQRHRELIKAERQTVNPAIGSVVTHCAADITMRGLTWLWPGWLAVGKLHILAGQPGTGKSTLAFSLAAVITTGGTWPDGTRCKEPGTVLIWSGEDSADDTIVPRLAATGADLSMVQIIREVTIDGGARRAFDPATDLAALAPLISSLKPVLLIVDSIVSAVGGDSHKNTETRRGLQPLVDLAEQFGTAIFGITHFTKGTAGRDPLERVTGSLAFGALPRIVTVAAKLDQGNRYGVERLFARAKSNIGPDGGGFGYDLPVVQVDAQDGQIETVTVTWGQPIDGRARELLAESVDQEESGATKAVREAQDFLQRTLSDGPQRVPDVKEAARANGIAERTLVRAKGALNVRAVKLDMTGGWVWQLPDPTEDFEPIDTKGSK